VIPTWGNLIGTGSLLNIDPFSNLEAAYYWSSDVRDPYDILMGLAGDFDFGGSGPDTWPVSTLESALAVHDGDVGAVPEPASILLLGLGLVGLAGIRRIKGMGIFTRRTVRTT